MFGAVSQSGTLVVSRPALDVVVIAGEFDDARNARNQKAPQATESKGMMVV
jgi:hypothetical protein